jgi:dienelactone hydrolase
MQEVHFASADTGVQLTAYWTPPDTNAAPGAGAVALVALHGCNGLPQDKTTLSYQRNRYVKMLHEAGAGVLFVDSFGPRGAGDLCALQNAKRAIREPQRRLDVIGALQWLANQEGIDRQRLGVLGWSHGGQTVLAVASATNGDMQKASVQPAALVAFYPGCTAANKELGNTLSAPLLVMSGALDNWTPAAPCRHMVERLQSAGQAARYVEYPDSYHAFDSASPVRERDNVGGTRSGKAMLGANAAARDASAQEMMQFLNTYLGLQKNSATTTP